VGLLEKKVYLGGMSILSILLSLKPRYHTQSLLDGFSRWSQPPEIERVYRVYLLSLNICGMFAWLPGSFELGVHLGWHVVEHLVESNLMLFPIGWVPSVQTPDNSP
jgi:hypothetical protein